MKSSLFSAAALVVGLLAAGTMPAMMPARAVAAELSPPVIAVLDMRAVRHDSKAGQAIQKHVDSKRKIYRSEISKEEKALRAQWDELSRQRSILSPDAYRKREEDFRQKEAAAKRRIATLEKQLNHDLRGTLVAATKVMDHSLQPILEKILKEKGIDLIVKSDNFIYAAPAYDITRETVSRLDKALPTIDMKKIEQASEKADKSGKSSKSRK